MIKRNRKTEGNGMDKQREMEWMNRIKIHTDN